MAKKITFFSLLLLFMVLAFSLWNLVSLSSSDINIALQQIGQEPSLQIPANKALYLIHIRISELPTDAESFRIALAGIPGVSYAIYSGRPLRQWLAGNTPRKESLLVRRESPQAALNFWIAMQPLEQKVLVDENGKPLPACCQPTTPLGHCSVTRDQAGRDLTLVISQTGQGTPLLNIPIRHVDPNGNANSTPTVFASHIGELK